MTRAHFFSQPANPFLIPWIAFSLVALRISRTTVDRLMPTTIQGVRFSGLLLGVALTGGPLLAAESAAMPEYSVKAAFLVNFVRYTTWPEHTFATDNTPIIIGVLGANPFVDVLAKTAENQQGGRRIAIRHVDTTEEAAECNVVFISEREKKNEATWIAALRKKPIVTIGESGETISRGGLLEFVTINNRVRFDASLGAMEGAGLKFSARLLQSARTIYRSKDHPR